MAAIIHRELHELDDYYLVPSYISSINSRSECNPYNDNGWLPVMAAPMASVIDEKNITKFLDNKIPAFIPRTISYETRMSQLVDYSIPIAVSISELSKILIEEHDVSGKILVDCANGHMLDLYEQIKEFKIHNPDAEIYTGNIANPDTYIYLCENYKDYLSGIRIGIGTGTVCLTSEKTAIHYPMGTLLEEIREYKLMRDKKSYIPVIADGGFTSYSRIIKALALGADYVMCGRLFADCSDACGSILNNTRHYYGMSTERAQKEMGNKTIKLTEGTCDLIPVNPEMTIQKKAEEIAGYIRSAMSYCNIREISYFNSCENDMIVNKHC